MAAILTDTRAQWMQGKVQALEPTHCLSVLPCRLFDPKCWPEQGQRLSKPTVATEEANAGNNNTKAANKLLDDVDKMIAAHKERTEEAVGDVESATAAGAEPGGGVQAKKRRK